MNDYRRDYQAFKRSETSNPFCPELNEIDRESRAAFREEVWGAVSEFGKLAVLGLAIWSMIHFLGPLDMTTEQWSWWGALPI